MITKIIGILCNLNRQDRNDFERFLKQSSLDDFSKERVLNLLKIPFTIEPIAKNTKILGLIPKAIPKLKCLQTKPMSLWKSSNRISKITSELLSVMVTSRFTSYFQSIQAIPCSLDSKLSFKQGLGKCITLTRTTKMLRTQSIKRTPKSMHPFSVWTHLKMFKSEVSTTMILSKMMLTGFITLKFSTTGV